MNQIDIKEILAKHKLWLDGSEGGVRAHLSGSNLSEANLSEADLHRADLHRANLHRANLHRADLSGSNLSEANLSEANLSGANLSEASLSGADLGGASLRGANLREANLHRADLSGSNLSGANLSEANLHRADLSGSNLSGANLPFVATEADLATKILERVESQPECLDMKTWHSCETTHCLAGWAVTLHSQGRLLESMLGPNAAGALIFNACCGEVPDFFSTEEQAIDWLKKTTPKDAS